LRRRPSRPKLTFEASGSWSNPQFFLATEFHLFALFADPQHRLYLATSRAGDATRRRIRRKAQALGAPMIREQGSHAAALRHDMHTG
jgi:hypothetical protein